MVDVAVGVDIGVVGRSDGSSGGEDNQVKLLAEQSQWEGIVCFSS